MKTTLQRFNASTLQRFNASTRKLFVAIFLVFSPLIVMSQSGVAPLAGINLQLRSLFAPLQLASPSRDFLFDMAAHSQDSIHYGSWDTVPINATIWSGVYDEFYYCAYDTTQYPRVDTVIQRAFRWHGAVKPLVISVLNYNTFKDVALTNGNYFNFDTINDILSDIPGRPNEPYIDTLLFSASCIYDNADFTNVTFRYSPDLLFADATMYNDIKWGKYNLKVDFNDGNGWQAIPDITLITDFNVVYADSGKKHINYGLFEQGDTIAYCRSNFGIALPVTQPQPAETLDTLDLNIGIFPACDGQQTKKVVIYLEGIDLTEDISNRGVGKIYKDMISNTKVDELRNFGYDFVVVDWKNSKRDMALNAESLIQLIKLLKCRYDNGHEFVIMGESMGGVIAQFALAKMENAPVQNPKECHFEKMHNTRLLITIDSPHRGANVPLGLQMFYKTTMPLLGPIVNFTMHLMNEGLESTAAKQLLIKHANTNIGNLPAFIYTEHPERTAWKVASNLVRIQPSFCKIVAISNGDLQGAKQVTDWNSSVFRTANDHLLLYRADLNLKLFGHWYPLTDFELEVNTNPNGTGTVYELSSHLYLYTLKLKWFKIKMVPLVTIPVVIPFAAIAEQPYCVNAGGQLDFSNDARAILTGNNAVYLGGGAYSNLSIHGGKKFGFSIEKYYQSNGFSFCFIPVFSALHYNVNALNHDIINDNNTVKTSKHPYDLIMGYHDHTNYEHQNLRNPYINNEYQQTCHDQPTSVALKEYLINQEIGGQTLYIDRRVAHWPATYSAERDLYVQEENPHYGYPPSTIGLDGGSFSKAAAVNFHNHNQVFDYGINFNYTTPITATYSAGQTAQPVCCISSETYSTARQAPPIKYNEQVPLDNTDSKKIVIGLYPNPCSDNCIISLKNLEQGKKYQLMVYDIAGKLATTQQINSFDKGYTNLTLEKPNLKPGYYDISLKETNGSTIVTVPFILLTN